jgi:RND superfamily putative drug exporter
VVALAAAASLVTLPPVLAVAGHRINRLDVFAPIRRRLHGSRTGRGVWYRLASAVIRRPAATGIVVTGLLVTLALPFTHVKFAITAALGAVFLVPPGKARLAGGMHGH